MIRKKGRYLLTALFAAVIVGGGGYIYHFISNADALWHIVSQECLPHQLQQGSPAPCKEVDLHARFAILKDLNGPLQYLLIPLDKMTGIESSVLLEEQTPNFFYHSWQARHYLAAKRGQLIADHALSLAVNAPSGRSQNQLHIHISCLRSDVRQLIDDATAKIGSGWQWLDTPLMGHTYLARRVMQDAVAAKSPFRMLADDVSDAKNQMGQYGLAMVQAFDGTFILLAGKRDLLRLNVASVEEIQDHSCAILRPPPKPELNTSIWSSFFVK